MARRGANEGSIRFRKDLGVWEARYRTSDGKRRSLYAKRRGELRRRLEEALAEARNGIKPIGRTLTVAEYLDDWVENSVKPRCKPSTYASYKETVRRYIAPAIGRRPLAKLEPEHVQSMLAQLTDRETSRRPLSPATVRYVRTILRSALGRALKAGLVMRNVATLVDVPAKARREIDPMTAAQVRAFLAHVADDRMSALYVTAIGLGLRQGELLALRWQDIDFERATLSVRHTLGRETRELTAPKTERSRRTLAMPRTVSDALRDHRRRQLEERVHAGARWTEHDFVFASTVGTPLFSRNVTQTFQQALASAGLPRKRFHDLRHTAATLLIEQGVPIYEVSRLLGHSSLSTTADIYGHLTNEMQLRTAQRMDQALGLDVA